MCICVWNSVHKKGPSACFILLDIVRNIPRSSTTSFLHTGNWSVHHGVTMAWIFNYAYISIACLNFDAPSWKFYIIALGPFRGHVPIYLYIYTYTHVHVHIHIHIHVHIHVLVSNVCADMVSFPLACICRNRAYKLWQVAWVMEEAILYFLQKSAIM